MPLLPKKNCVCCGELYQPPREKSRFCSKHCTIKTINKERAKPKVTKVCPACNIEFTLSYAARNTKVCCSKSCGTKFGMSKVDLKEFGAKISKTRRANLASGKVVQTGHPHSEETKAHLSKLALERAANGVPNAMFGKNHSLESKQKMSDTRTRKMVNKEYDLSKFAKKGEIYSQKANRTIPYRSLWEKRTVQILEQDESVESFQFEPLRIPYYRKEAERMNLRHYVPDFLIAYKDGKKKLVEVKPDCHVDAQINQLKFAAAREYCKDNNIEFEVWTQDTLGPIYGEVIKEQDVKIL